MRRSLLLTAVADGCLAETECNRRLVGVLLDTPPSRPRRTGGCFPEGEGGAPHGSGTGAGVGVIPGGVMAEKVLTVEDALVPENETTLRPVARHFGSRSPTARAVT